MKYLKSLVLHAGLLFVLFSFAAPAAASPSASVSLDSWVYPALERLSGLGLLDSALQGSRPFSRLEVARQAAEARSRNSGAPAVALQLLRRLETEFRTELAELDRAEGATAAGYFKPLREAELRYVYQHGEDSPMIRPRLNARQFALNYNNFGIDYEQRHNGQLTFTSEARLGGFLLLDLQPLLEVQEEEESDGKGTTGDLRFLHGKAALGLGPFELSAGRQSLWWGQGRHGALILTDNAKPLDMVRLTNPSPVLLPWLFEYLGPFRFDLFLSRLEEDRGVPEPYFAGLRLNIKPLPWVEVGASRTVIYGGEGRPSVGLDDFVTILTGTNLTGAKDTSNSLAALDGRIRLPFLWGAEVYGEMGGEDEAGGFISNKAYLGGLFLPRLEPSGRLAWRLEYADLSHIDTNSPPWYQHSVYRSGYTYQGKILGHHVGTAAEDVFSELEILLPWDLALNLGFDYEKRGFDQAVPERHRQASVKIAWAMNGSAELSAYYAVDRVRNFAYVAGEEKDLQFGWFSVAGRW